MIQVELEPIADTKSDKEITMTKSPTKIRWNYLLFSSIIDKNLFKQL